ncbi:MAG: peptidoglycan recognition protein family protein [Goleter apudmare HA4340-LM2]|jgi:hypothetical protein|nr:peptidoglycan recognition protein family protein [Goleter apudmare HA4340-LM2]
MSFRDWASKIILISLLLIGLAGALLVGETAKLQNQTATSYPGPISWNQTPEVEFQSAKTEPEKSQKVPVSPVPTKAPIKQNQTKVPVKQNPTTVKYKTTEAFAQYRPRYEIASVNPTNYGERFATDINGVSAYHEPIVVIHETANSASSAVNFFQAPHSDENVQASYHSLIKQDGTVVYLVPPDKRAFGAGNSVFVGANGPETVQTNPSLPPSVNNFAYHVSLETPPDAWGVSNIKGHSGYTEAQYYSLAWLIAQSQIPIERITTHQAVDRSGKKVDPLSFEPDKFLNLLITFRQATKISQAQ